MLRSWTQTQGGHTVKPSSAGDLQGQPQAKEPGSNSNKIIMTCALQASKGEVEASEAWQLMRKEGFGVKTAA